MTPTDVPPKKYSRRFFLRWTIRLVVYGTVGHWFYRAIKGTDYTVSVIQRELGFLKIDDETLMLFAKDYREFATQQEWGSIESATFLAPLDNLAKSLGGSGWSKAFGSLDYDICSRFLLSTDFFPKGADESRPLKYLSFHNPFAGCMNHFADISW